MKHSSTETWIPTFADDSDDSPAESFDDALSRLMHFQTATAYDGFGSYLGDASPGGATDRVSATAIGRRQSVRAFSTVAIPKDLFAPALAATYAEDATGHCEVPSAGNIQAVKFLAICSASRLVLTPTKKTSFEVHPSLARDIDLRGLLFGRVTGDPWIVIIYSDAKPYLVKYGLRALRLMYLEAGHLCQSLIWETQRAGFVGCPFGAFDDSIAAKLIFEPSCTNIPLYIYAVGYPAA